MKFYLVTILAIMHLVSASHNGEWIAEGIWVDAEVDPEYMAAAFEAKRYLKYSQDRDIAGKSCTGQNDCCTAENKCGLGEGDCDSDQDCLGNLICGLANKLCKRTVVIPGTSGWGLDTRSYRFTAAKTFTFSDNCCQLPESLASTLKRGNKKA